MKKYLILLSALFAHNNTFACDICKKQQPKFLQDIVHGTGPESKWDYLIVAVMVLVTLYVLISTINCFIRPRETSNEHIKRMILKD